MAEMNPVLIEISDGVLRVQLNRPYVGNAFDASVIADLKRIFSSPFSFGEVRAIRLSGSGENFCTGADLRWMQAASRLSPEENISDMMALCAMYEAMLKCEVPVFARVHGHVLGGGVGLTSAATIAAALPSSTFRLPEAGLGLIPGIVSPLLKLKCGASADLEAKLVKGAICAQEALELGLVDFHGTDEEVEQFFGDCLKGLRSFQRRNSGWTEDWSETLRQAAILSARHRVSSLARKGLADFFSRREKRRNRR